VLLALALIESVWLTAVALFLLGYAGVITAAGCNTALQLASSAELQGRVMSLFTMIHGGSFPIAAFLIGVVAERWSESAAFFVWGAGGLAALALLMGNRRLLERRQPTLAQTPDDPDEPRAADRLRA
jgi:MFS family permease